MNDTVLSSLRVSIWAALLFSLPTFCHYVVGLLRKLDPHANSIVRARWLAPAQVRAAWSLAVACYAVHVLIAFAGYHRWSHEQAVEHTQAQSGFGQGVWVSYFFSLAWMGDAIVWWVVGVPGCVQSPGSQVGWPRAILYGFFLFILFNGAVVFANGPSRWIGIAFFVCLIFVVVNSRGR